MQESFLLIVQNNNEPPKPLTDEEIWQKVDDWFEKADTNKDGKLSLAEASEYIKKWIQDEYSI